MKTQQGMLLQTDSGFEFRGRGTQNFFNSMGIKHFVTRNSSTKSSLIEIANRTLEGKLYKYMTHNSTLKYYDVLQDIVASLNDRKHRVLKMSPNEAAKQKNHKIVFDTLYKTYLEKRNVGQKYPVGQRVRLSKHRHVFSRGYLPGYSKQIYTIAQSLKTRPSTYRLLNEKQELLPGLYYNQELSRVA
jgi:hypothetical protein